MTFRTMPIAAAAAAAGAAQRFEAMRHAARPVLRPRPAGCAGAVDLSDRFAGPGGRVETLHRIREPGTGLSRPFPAQPLQGFSGIRSLGDGRFPVLTDNGVGSKTHPADAMPTRC